MFVLRSHAACGQTVLPVENRYFRLLWRTLEMSDVEKRQRKAMSGLCLQTWDCVAVKGNCRLRVTLLLLRPWRGGGARVTNAIFFRVLGDFRKVSLGFLRVWRWWQSMADRARNQSNERRPLSAADLGCQQADIGLAGKTLICNSVKVRFPFLTVTCCSYRCWRRLDRDKARTIRWTFNLILQSPFRALDLIVSALAAVQVFKTFRLVCKLDISFLKKVKAWTFQKLAAFSLASGFCESKVTSCCFGLASDLRQSLPRLHAHAWPLHQLQHVTRVKKRFRTKI